MRISLFQGVLIGIFGLGAFIGLFVFSTYSGGSNSGAGGIGTVVIWGTLPRESIEATLAAVAQAEPTMKNVSYVQKNPETLSTDLASAIATGSSPDLVLASQEQLQSLVKFLMPIPSGTLSTSAFRSAFVDEGGLFAVPNGGGYYGIPFLVDPLILFWNSTILSSSGIAKPPTTWEGLMGLVPNVAILTPTRQITRALIALGSYDNVHNARGILSALFLQIGVPLSGYAGGGFLSGNLGLTATGGTTQGPQVLGFYTTFADPSKESYTWNSSWKDSRQAFQTGDLALYLGYASESRFFVAANPNLNFSVAPLPQPGTASLRSTYGLVYAFMIPRSAKNSAGAYQAAALLANTTEQGIAARTTGLAPAARSALSTVPSDPTLAVAYASALYARGWLSPAPADVDMVFSSMIGNIVSGRLDVTSAISRAQSSLTSLLQQ